MEKNTEKIEEKLRKKQATFENKKVGNYRPEHEKKSTKLGNKEKTIRNATLWDVQWKVVNQIQEEKERNKKKESLLPLFLVSRNGWRKSVHLWCDVQWKEITNQRIEKIKYNRTKRNKSW